MSTLRGMDGSVSLGGVISVGSPTIKGAVSTGASTAVWDGNGATLQGVVAEGDTFTVAGDAQSYTIATVETKRAERIGATVANEVTVTFTPTVQAGAGWADNAAVTFDSNAMTEVREWQADVPRVTLQDTVLGDPSRTYKLAQIDWTATLQTFLDYADARQKEFVDAVLSGSSLAVGLTLIATDGKQLFGVGLAPDLQVTDRFDSLLEAQMSVQGDTALAIDWN